MCLNLVQAKLPLWPGTSRGKLSPQKKDSSLSTGLAMYGDRACFPISLKGVCSTPSGPRVALLIYTTLQLRVYMDSESTVLEHIISMIGD